MNRLPFALICCLWAGAAIVAETPSTQPADVQTLAFPTFGATFEMPAGWREIPREKSGRLGQWISADSSLTTIHSLIMIETGRSNGSMPEVFAKGLARNFGGIVLEEPTKLGGESAFRVRADNHDDEVAPTEGIVCVHSGNVFLVMGGTKKGRSVQKEIDAIAASWKWTEVQKPSAHLAFRGEAFSVFDGSVQLNAPNLMHENPSDDPHTQFDLALFNLVRNAADFRATLTLARLNPDETLEMARDRLAKDVSGRYKFMKDQPLWVDCKGSTPRLMTNVVEAERPQPAETDTLHHQWALVSLGAGNAKVVLIHFTYETESDEDRAKFEEAAEKILVSVESVKK